MASPSDVRQWPRADVPWTDPYPSWDPPAEAEPPPLPFVVRHFHAVCLMLVFIAVGLQWPLGVFSAQAPLDPYVHFIFPMASGSIIVSTLFWDDPPRTLPAMIMVGTIGVTLEVLWEIIEFTGDHLFHLHWQVDNSDTMWDLIIGVIGAAAGAVAHAAIEDAK